MILTSDQIGELMQWARDSSPVSYGNDPVGDDLIHAPVRLEIGNELWEAELYDYSHYAIVARVYLRDSWPPAGTGRSVIMPWMPLAEKRIL